MKIKVTSGEYAGRFIGQNLMGLITNPAILNNPPIPLVDIPYSLHALPQMAMAFPEAKARAIQAQLAVIGLSSEILG